MIQLLEQLKFKRLKTQSDCENIEQLEISSIAGGN